MTLTQLATFIRIAELGSVSKAAAVVRVAQPALSRHIRCLEEELGSSLFVRHSRGLSLTPAGEVFLERARRVLIEAEAARDAVAAYAGHPAGRVTLGVPTSLASTLIPSLGATLSQRFPKVRPHFVDGFSAVLHVRTVAGELDLAILYDDRANMALSTAPLFNEELTLIGPAHALIEPGATAEMLDRRTLILPSRPNRLRLIVDSVLAQAVGASVVEVDSLPAIIAMVRRGAGWTVLPYSSVTDEVERNEVSVWDLNSPELSRTLVLAKPTQRETTPATQAVERELRSLVRSLASSLRWTLPDGASHTNSA